MRGLIGFATLILLLAAVPVLFIEGVTGAFLSPLVRAYALAVVASMVVALTVTPALGSVLMKPRPRRPGPDAAPPPDGRYGRVLTGLAARPRWVIAGAAVGVLAAIALIPLMKGPVIPSFKDRDVVARLTATPGTSRPEMARILATASHELRAIPGVDDVTGHLGRAITGDQVVDVNSGELWVSIGRDADYDATKARIEAVVAGYPGLAYDVSTYERRRIREVAALDDRQAAGAGAGSGDLDVLTGSDRRPLLVRVYGEDPATLRAQAARMQRMLTGSTGSSIRASRRRSRSRPSRSRSTWPGPSGWGSSRATCGGRRPRCCRASRWGASSASRRSSRSSCAPRPRPATA